MGTCVVRECMQVMRGFDVKTNNNLAMDFFISGIAKTFPRFVSQEFSGFDVRGR